MFPIVLSLIALSACSTRPSPHLVPPPDLTQSCDPIRPLPDGLTMTGLAKRYAMLIGQYNECAMRHESLSSLLRGE
ncbi:Rz1-like lysis system protein LysC [Singulisphaera rosea]